ncbi:MAG: hypothetical protein AAGG09_18380 [Pseudomonadota bacterium]
MGLISGSDPIASWWLAIVVVLVVTLVVAILLRAIIREAAAIEDGVAVVWANGQRVANNTIHIAAIYKTHEFVEGILGRAGRIATSAKAIEDHAKHCDACPRCIWHRG